MSASAKQQNASSFYAVALLLVVLCCISAVAASNIDFQVSKQRHNTLMMRGEHHQEADAGSGFTSKTVNQLHVGSFNIQVFGVKKESDASVLHTLVQTITRYDICFIMEIRDSTDTAIHKLLDQLNAWDTSRHYKLVISERLGRSASKEQYAYVYDSIRVKLVAEYQYVDTQDYFERAPFSAVFQPVGTTDAPQNMIWFTGLHTKPTAAAQEIGNMLADVYQEFATVVPQSVIPHRDQLLKNNWILMGDLNAGCSYCSNKKIMELKAIAPKFLGSTFDWLINSDTTTRQNGCTYDRFVSVPAMASSVVASKQSKGSKGKAMKKVVSNAPQITDVKVFNFREAYSLSLADAILVSDHFPIEFKVNF